MFAWIATRTGVRIPSPPIFACNEVESEGRRAEALAKADFFYVAMNTRQATTCQSPKPSGCRAVALAKADYSPKICSSQFVCNFLARVKNKASHGEARGAITVINPIGTLDLASMNYRLLGKLFYHSAILLACVTLSCRPQQAVILSPGDTDLVVLNGCVISACNYLAVVKTQHALDENFWAKILLVRYNDHPAGHAYCVWETDGTIYGYDRNAGSFPIPVYTRDARAIAIVLAQELGKVMNEPLSVDRAEFVESQHARVYKF